MVPLQLEYIPSESLQDIATQRTGYLNGLPSTIPSFSFSATVKEFRKFQNTPEYTNHCNRGSNEAVPPIPVTLLHPVFGQFLDDCKSLQTTAADNSFAREVGMKMSEVYAYEDTRDYDEGRASVLRGLFRDWGLHFIPTTIEAHHGKKYFTDGDISLDGYRYAILEVKNEVGSGSSDPYAQASLYYQESNRRFVANVDSVLPCFLVLVFGSFSHYLLDLSADRHGTPLLGPYIAFAGAAWNVCSTTEIFSVLPLHYHPMNIEMQCTVARNLCAMKKAIHALRLYYNSPLPRPPVPAPNLVFPHPTFYFTSPDSQEQAIVYEDKFENRLLFSGKELNAEGRKICIKFVRSYSMDAHAFCASKGHAPTLLGHRDLPGGWLMIVMEQLDSNYIPLHQCSFPTDSAKAMLVDRIQEAIYMVHREGYVHGDLREANIMVNQHHTTHKFMIIDWDWSGAIQVARYPMHVNQEVMRPEGAIDGKLILPEHDMKMLDYIREAPGSAAIGLKRPLPTPDLSPRRGKLQKMC